MHSRASGGIIEKGERGGARSLLRDLAYARTGRPRVGVPPHVAERCLNHSLGAIESTYDTHDYLDERREALAKLGAYLALQLDTSANVVRMPGAAVRG